MSEHRHGLVTYVGACPVCATEPGTPQTAIPEHAQKEAEDALRAHRAEPGTPQTAYGRSLDDEIGDTVVAGGSVREYILAIEAEARAAADLAMVPVIEATAGMAADNARAARDAEVRAAVETMPTARIISQWDLVSRKAVLAILDADTPS